MAQDTFTEVTSRSWGSRLGGAFKGILFGLLMIAVALWLLFWNEGRAVERAKTLAEGGKAVVSVAAEPVDPANEGRLVHVTGMAVTGDILIDEDFGIAANAIRLERQVEMYQWQESQTSETRKKVGGGTETTTTYSYDKGWSERAVDSGSFKRPEGHENPGAMPYESRQLSATDVTVGAFRLPPSLAGRIGGARPLPVESLDGLPEHLEWRAQLHGGGIYVGYDPAAPEIGDLRISFQVVEPAVVSLVAQQVGDTFEPYRARAGGTIEMLRMGTASAEAMIEAAEQSNRVLTWLLRLVGFVVMFVGFKTVLRPLSVTADVLPFLGNVVGTGTGFVSFGLAAVLSLVTVAVAWVFYRPLLGVTLLVLAVVAVVVLRRKLKRAPAPQQAPPPPPPPPPAA